MYLLSRHSQFSRAFEGLEEQANDKQHVAWSDKDFTLAIESLLPDEWYEGAFADRRNIEDAIVNSSLALCGHPRQVMITHVTLANGKELHLFGGDATDELLDFLALFID